MVDKRILGIILCFWKGRWRIYLDLEIIVTNLWFVNDLEDLEYPQDGKDLCIGIDMQLIVV